MNIAFCINLILSYSNNIIPNVIVNNFFDSMEQNVNLTKLPKNINQKFDLVLSVKTFHDLLLKYQLTEDNTRFAYYYHKSYINLLEFCAMRISHTDFINGNNLIKRIILKIVQLRKLNFIFKNLINILYEKTKCESNNFIEATKVANDFESILKDLQIINYSDVTNGEFKELFFIKRTIESFTSVFWKQYKKVYLNECFNKLEYIEKLIEYEFGLLNNTLKNIESNKKYSYTNLRELDLRSNFLKKSIKTFFSINLNYTKTIIEYLKFYLFKIE
ncbi:hypothetical protein A0H76_1038 [Hepatospora eriocheir]|uniref:Uncharacterized protein n=1 Tax=Hepatospora eriocheir TaxID=1081669 RepID=A0A1X0QHU2_9MICR|nr:hypothetical protein A0H76_1038 [Hepatospora eriocheir]